MDIFFNKYTVGPLYPWVLHPQIQATTAQKQYFGELTDLEGQRMHSLFYTILYKGFEHPQICIYAGGREGVLESTLCEY